MLTESAIAAFRSAVYEAARINQRRFPWRETTDPYRIMVSEIMLQQTQVERVSAKFIDFIGRFPDVTTLAMAELSDVLNAWQGLGYNRRALSLKRAAEAVVSRFGGSLPLNRKELESLPGIGTYTAGAIMTFAFNMPEQFIETNIRTVYIHHFFENKTGIHDRQLLTLVERTLDSSNPREWYNALMDYGASLKRQHPNPSRRSAHHSRQSPFAGSNRQLRSALLRMILAHPGISADNLASRVTGCPDKISANLMRMEQEGLITRNGDIYCVA